MKTETHSKNERINLRLNSSVKNLIARAAGFEGKTVSSFILNSALEHARKTVHEHELMVLNENNSKTFFDALSARASFNNKLLAALEEHDQRVLSK